MTVRGKVPSKSNCYRVVRIGGRGALAKSAALRAYERSFYAQCGARGAGVSGYFRLTMDVYHENMRPDLDNAFKVVLDCLQSCGAVSDDRRCMEIRARKLVDKLDPRVELEIEEIDI